MLAVIDVGNTNIVLGIFEGEKFITSWRLGTNQEKTADEYGMTFAGLFASGQLDISKVEAVIIASVVPPVMYSLEHAVRKYFNVEPMVMRHDTNTGIQIRYDHPQEIGMDRIVNAVAATRKYGAPLVIVDFGTATTFCVINSSKEYVGGVICPGIKISSEALFHRASKLPRVEIAKPKHTIGTNTVAGMQSGIFYGYTGQVDYLVKRIKAEMNEDNIKVIATGGLARLIASESETIDIIDGMLTLEGLQMIYEMNR